jgi:hypothetical protein
MARHSAFRFLPVDDLLATWGQMQSMQFVVRAAPVQALMCAALLAPTPAPASEPPRPMQKISIDARLAEGGETLEGTIEMRIVNDTRAPLDSIPLWLYPNRFAGVSENLDDRMVRWIYPSGESDGGIEIDEPRWNGEALPAGNIAKTGLRVSGSHSTDVMVEVDVRIALPEGMGAVLHDRVFPWDASARIIEAKHLRAEELVLVAMDMMEVDAMRFEWGEVIHVHKALNQKEPGWKDTRIDQGDLPGGLKDEGAFSVSSRIFEVVGNTEGLVRAAAPGCKLADRLVLVSIPAWDHLVQQCEFRKIWPVPFRKFCPVPG